MRFFDVGGIPVKVETVDDRLSVMACDPAPRVFPSELVFRQGTEISRENFDQLVKAYGGVDHLRSTTTKRLWPDDEYPDKALREAADARLDMRGPSRGRPAEDC